jgi:hypothetical protein
VILYDSGLLSEDLRLKNFIDFLLVVGGVALLLELVLKVVHINLLLDET